jgi:hypothetical protein
MPITEDDAWELSARLGQQDCGLIVDHLVTFLNMSGVHFLARRFTQGIKQALVFALVDQGSRLASTIDPQRTPTCGLCGYRFTEDDPGDPGGLPGDCPLVFSKVLVFPGSTSLPITAHACNLFAAGVSEAPVVDSLFCRHCLRVMDFPAFINLPPVKGSDLFSQFADQFFPHLARDSDLFSKMSATWVK